MSIWHHEPDIAAINAAGANSMVEWLGIVVTGVGGDYLEGTMPVDHRTLQPQGILHGGANVTLAETLGSIASTLCLDPARKFCVGMDINANHVRPVTGGKVTGIARALHVGRTTHVWNIEISSDQGKLISVARLTMAVRDRNAG